jgi:Fe-S cluster biogenesis protein NfuA
LSGGRNFKGAKEYKMLDKERVSEVLDDIRGALQAHGGDVKLVEVTDDGTVKVELQGACRGCPMAQMTIQRGVEARLKQEIPEVKEVVPVAAPIGSEE